MRSDARPARLRNTAVGCALFLLVDVSLFGAPVLALYVGLFLVLWSAPRILVGLLRRERQSRRVLGALMLAAALYVDGIAWGIQERVARTRTVVVADALDRYRARHDVYPRELSQLVPDFLPHVPSPKPAVAKDRFQYVRSDDDAGLLYVSVPPFLRVGLHVRTRRWGSLD